MKGLNFLLVACIGLCVLTFSACDEECTTPTTWYLDADGDGLGDPTVTEEACEQPDGYVADNTDTDDAGSLHAAFSTFDSDNFTIYIEGSEVVIESNGYPNHTSPYWSTTHALYVAPTATTTQAMAPGNIDNFSGSYTLRVPLSPQLAASSSSTGLGAIGMAISGGMIYNDEEGPNVPLDDAIVSFDYTGAHTGPQSYHYHLEPHAWSDDDEKLIGIISDGFFLYGRKCNSTGTYPTDLDASGGHSSTTQHATSEEYHYHIANEVYLNQYYILLI